MGQFALSQYFCTIIDRFLREDQKHIKKNSKKSFTKQDEGGHGVPGVSGDSPKDNKGQGAPLPPEVTSIKLNVFFCYTFKFIETAFMLATYYY